MNKQEWLEKNGFNPENETTYCVVGEDTYSIKDYYYEDSKRKVEKKIRRFLPKSNSQYIGEIGERIRNQTAIFKSVRGFNGAFGWTNIFTFNIGENVLVWFTQKDLNLEKGMAIDLTGTIKKHEEYREVKTTVLTRCIIKSIETEERVEE